MQIHRLFSDVRTSFSAVEAAAFSKQLANAAGGAALLRLLWATEHRPASVHDFPRLLVAGRCPTDFCLPMVKSDAGRVADLLRRLLTGQDDDLIRLFASSTAFSPAADLCQRRIHEADVEALRLFHRSGPARNRDLRLYCGYDCEVIAPEDLDDLLALTSKPSRPAETDAP